MLSADERKISILALLDLSAAFDTIGHKILIDRLKITFGFDNIVLNWFRSCVSDRTQSVKIEDFESTPVPLPFDVPQGSVLEPILYTLYTTPLGSIIRNHNLNYHMYADNTQIYLSIESPDIFVLISSLENCLNDIKYWMLVNKFKLNDEKTEIILCNHKNYNITVDELSVGKEKINILKTAKKLGSIF